MPSKWNSITTAVKWKADVSKANSQVELYPR